jgi:hypothetical protein
MTTDPKDAYEAAKRKREQDQQAQAQAEAERETLPKLVETKLGEIAAALNSSIPPGLRLDMEYTLAGGMDRTGGRKGVKGLYLKLDTSNNRVFDFRRRAMSPIGGSRRRQCPEQRLSALVSLPR